jgi:alkyl hydroperoxide reductase subunit AhpC
MLSDFMRDVSKDYGILIAERGIANRATFVVDKSGRISHVEEGRTAVDPMAALQACQRKPLSR